MIDTVDTKRLFDNIYFLLEEKNTKVGELEKELEITPGYISRTRKDGGRPSIDFLWNVAQFFNTHIDIIVSVDLQKLTETERFIINFVEKMTKDTFETKLNWKAEENGFEKKIMTISEGSTDHRLFSTKEVTVYDNVNGYPESWNEPVFLSKAFGENTKINGTCYYTQIEEDVYIYLMSVCGESYEDEEISELFNNDIRRESEEIWMYQNGNTQCLACTYDSEYLREIVIALKDAVADNAKHTAIEPEFRDTLNKYMGLEKDTSMTSNKKSPKDERISKGVKRRTLL